MSFFEIIYNKILKKSIQFQKKKNYFIKINKLTFSYSNHVFFLYIYI